MKYASPAALSRAIADVLSAEAGGDVSRYEQLRRNVAFERVLARLVAEDQDIWLLKGGVALDYRLSESRSTMDLDLSSKVDLSAFQDKLVRAMAIDLGDFFEIQLLGETFRPVDEIETYRFAVDVRLNDRRFMRMGIDVGFADPWLGTAEVLKGSDVLGFAGVKPVTVKAIPIEQHIAEKFHAYTRAYGGRQSSRVKDLVDLLLLSAYRPVTAVRLAAMLDSVFRSRATHDLPKSFPFPPEDWGDVYRKLSETLPITSDITEAHANVGAFLDPVLGSRGAGSWDPITRIWVTAEVPV